MSLDKPLSKSLKIVDFTLRLYQVTISPDHGPLQKLFPAGVCRHYPTCSQYARQAIRRWGARGCLFAARRLLHCHPLSRGGYDPVYK